MEPRLPDAASAGWHQPPLLVVTAGGDGRFSLCLTHQTCMPAPSTLDSEVKPGGPVMGLEPADLGTLVSQTE